MNILLTGAASGIGKAAIEQLYANGHTIYALDIDEKGLMELPPGIKSFEADVSQEEQVHNIIADIELDAVVNCAGYYELGAIEDMDATTVERHFQTNVFGTLHVIRHALPTLRRNEGRIVNVSSLLGRVALPFFGVYAATKHSITAITEAVRHEVDSHDVNVILVEPGPVNTGFNERAKQYLHQYVPDSPYTARYERLLKSDGMNGVEPKRVAKPIVTAVEAQNPRQRYPVTLQARLAPVLKTIIPPSLWKRVVKILVDSNIPLGMK